ncbi:E3 ubiquitin/ISG15 ligase TRIM25-like [Thalassophryne amazonica]|uniref:E3 ubiquitin/ISG15 ligase TRIM25-like n=1 Tax=Thalassophryne amazonica TaxID=390379 RepID=UPI001470E175|nr:E3 ubiquitin/ISG15 ligase TRIM25-like [Thalassophryne amazonica]
MAECMDGELSLLSLEDELTCSICLSAFDCPVTIPCGHNFCQNCLLSFWTDTYSCPQCRCHFPTKPELKKNTVLATVVHTFKMKQTRAEDKVDEVQVEKKAFIHCDTCMEAEAFQTCFTCMASFCEEHLRPHRENPRFHLHQLSESVIDLSEHICPDHHKLLELFCTQHDRLICSLCLQQAHKGCNFTTTEERRNVNEFDLRAKLDVLDGKITKNENCVSQMRDMQNKLKDSATNKKSALTAVYQEMKDMLAQDEREALNVVESELESGQTKIRGFMKKFTDNIDKMSKAKDEISNLLSQSQTLTFLEAAVDLPAAVKFEPFVPRVNLDSKKVTAVQTSAVGLKKHLTEVFKQPFEARLPLPEVNTGIVQTGEFTVNTDRQTPMMPSEGPVPPLGYFRSHLHHLAPDRPCGIYSLFSTKYTCFILVFFSTVFFFLPTLVLEFMGPPGHPNFVHFLIPGNQPMTRPGQKKKVQQEPKKPPQPLRHNKNHARSMENINLDFSKQPLRSPTAEKPKQELKKMPKEEPKEELRETPETSVIPPNVACAEKRNDLLKYSTVLTLDPRTAHKRIILSEGFTKADVSDEPADYPDCPERFTVCSQVLTTKGFSRGRHYWEVKLSSNNFLGIGLAYGSIDRKGPTSRLGRNCQSWCIEWFNVRLSAWHNSTEVVLHNPNPKRIGVLVDCEEGTATFYGVADRAYPFHCFVFPFTEAVFPAFWIFSSGSSISLCKLQP